MTAPKPDPIVEAAEELNRLSELVLEDRRNRRISQGEEAIMLSGIAVGMVLLKALRKSTDAEA